MLTLLQISSTCYAAYGYAHIYSGHGNEEKISHCTAVACLNFFLISIFVSLFRMHNQFFKYQRYLQDE
jgi:preprotein translocase subunit SecG